MQIFENEVAQMLCKTMKGIERPSLSQLNETIVANICPMFLPKTTLHGDDSSRRSALIDDVTHLCAHPGYKFLDIKVTPQTSNKSVDFTYDTWSTLLKTIQQMQLSGAASERNIKAHLKHALTTEAQMNGNTRGRLSSAASVSMSIASAQSNVSSYMNHKHSLSGASESANFLSPLGKHTSTYNPRHSASVRSSSAVETDTSGLSESVVRSLASVLTLHGLDAPTQLNKLQRSYDQAFCPWRCPEDEDDSTGTSAHHSSSAYASGSSVSSTRRSPHSGEKSKARAPSALQALQQQQQQAELQLHELYHSSHSPLLAATGGDRSAVKICASSVPMNGYQRATSVLANSQAVLPLLQRAARGGAELYEAGAYLHQYSTYGIEEDDFLSAFRSVGGSIQNYLQL